MYNPSNLENSRIDSNVVYFHDFEGNLQLLLPLGENIFCQDHDCAPSTPAFWNCDLTMDSFSGCNKTMCDEHCRKISFENPIGWMGKSKSKLIDSGRVLAYSCGDTKCCRTMDNEFILKFTQKEKKEMGMKKKIMLCMSGVCCTVTATVVSALFITHVFKT